MRSILQIVLFLTFLSAPSSPATARQHEAQRPGRVELDNQSVRVTRIRIGPHERIPMHSLGARLVVWLTDVHLRDSLANGKIEQVEHKAGEVTWVPAQRHAGTNLSAAPIEFLAVEVKAHR